MPTAFQAQVSLEPVERFDITLAYRFNDVKSTINGTIERGTSHHTVQGTCLHFPMQRHSENGPLTLPDS